MDNLILFIFGVIGMTHIVVNGKILEPVRNLMRGFLPEFLSSGLDCTSCMGFWCGLFCGYVMLADNLWILLISGFAGSFLANFGDWVLLVMEEITIGKPNE